MALKNSGIKIAGFVLTVLVLVFGGGMAWSDLKNGMDTVRSAMAETKLENGKAETKQDEKIDQKVDQEAFQEVKQDVKDMTIKVAKMEARQGSMEGDIKEIKDDMKEGFRAIMEKLDED